MITHAVYLVDDAERAVVFLQEILNFRVSADELTSTGERFLAMVHRSAAGLQLQIVICDFHSEYAARKRHAGIVDYIVDTSDILAFISMLGQLGIRIHKEPVETSYGITAIFEDPFGNLWDLVQRPGVS